MEDRALRVMRKLEEADIDVAFLLEPHNVFYLAGWASVCSGVVVFRDSDPIFCTLWLDAPEATKVCAIRKTAAYVFPKDSLIGRMIKLVQKVNPTPGKIAVEKDFMVLRDYEAVTSAFPEARVVHVTPLIDGIRAIKSPEEIDKMKRSAAISDKVMDAGLKAVGPGVSEMDVAAEAEYVMRKLGSERPAFGTFVASGSRTLLAHPHATHKLIQPYEPVVIDLGATWMGYASDICRTTFTGEPTKEQKAYLRVVVRAQEAAANALKEGALAGEVFNAAYGVFVEHKLGSLLPKDIGYGVGLRQSEFFPIIEKDNPTILKANMVVALLQTAAANPKIGGLRVEDTFRITSTGCERLTTAEQPWLDQ